MSKSPTLSQVRHKWFVDLQVQGLAILDHAAKTSRPALYISAMLQSLREERATREVTYLTKFLLHHAEQRGLLSS